MGARGGIGKAVVRRFADLGARVAFTYRAEADKADAVVRDLQSSGAVVKAIPADITDAVAVAELMRNVATAFGHIDILVNNAGTFGVRAIGDVDYTFYADQFNVNVWGTLQVTQAALALFPDSAAAGSSISLRSGRFHRRIARAFMRRPRRRSRPLRKRLRLSLDREASRQRRRAGSDPHRHDGGNTSRKA
ncbi:SDR family oxidoreductase [Bradyrhizobium sp. NAS80.1]|uniref:SDR family NAD(P)-dependent oxidoreductase n=1 Tax=Bradyrhizobium sp. NAS80.1 TaxID=1680159 RepID=UPI001AF009FC|nr:SDR family oxidoreductase [Bradyrhizobium sp. NAS80.1]